MHNQKNKIIIAMLVVMVFMATGYAFFSTYLNINATGSITGGWNVYFSKIEKKEVVGGATDNSTPSITSTTATIDVNLALPGDSITYDITLTNGGNIDAIIEDIEAVGEGTDAIIYTISGLKIGDKLAGGASKVLSIKIEYDNNVTSQPTSTYKRVTIDIDAVQDIGQSITVTDPQIATKLSSKILSSNIAYATNTSSPYVEASTGIDFSKPSSDTNGKGLYMANDDDGVSYFFRGDVDNNYVQFGGDFVKKETKTTTKYYVVTEVYDYYHYLGYGRYDTESECEDSDELLDSVDEAYCYYIEEESKYAVVFITYGGNLNGDPIYDEEIECYDSSEFNEPVYDDLGNEPYYERSCLPIDIEEEIETNVPPIIWRIVRINGDGSIRLIVDFNPDILIYYMAHDFYSKGFFINYDESDAKTSVNRWYNMNLSTKDLTRLEDTTFCNDRSDGGYEYSNHYYYGPYLRLFPTLLNPSNPSNPILTCNREEDRLTVSNGKLTNPIGLITADEAVLAGEGSYLSYSIPEELGNSSMYVTMTAAWTDSEDYNSNFQVGETVNLEVNVDYAYKPSLFIRPVINLKSDTLVTGDGTIDNPYVVKTN